MARAPPITRVNIRTHLFELTAMEASTTATTELRSYSFEEIQSTFNCKSLASSQLQVVTSQTPLNLPILALYFAMRAARAGSKKDPVEVPAAPLLFAGTNIEFQRFAGGLSMVQYSRSHALPQAVHHCGYGVDLSHQETRAVLRCIAARHKSPVIVIPNEQNLNDEKAERSVADFSSEFKDNLRGPATLILVSNTRTQPLWLADYAGLEALAAEPDSDMDSAVGLRQIRGTTNIVGHLVETLIQLKKCEGGLKVNVSEGAPLMVRERVVWKCLLSGFTQSQAAAMVGAHKATISRLISAGRIPPIDQKRPSGAWWELYEHHYSFPGKLVDKLSASLRDEAF